MYYSVYYVTAYNNPAAPVLSALVQVINGTIGGISVEEEILGSFLLKPSLILLLIMIAIIMKIDE